MSINRGFKRTLINYNLLFLILSNVFRIKTKAKLFQKLLLLFNKIFIVRFMITLITLSMIHHLRNLRYFIDILILIIFISKNKYKNIDKINHK